LNLFFYLLKIFFNYDRPFPSIWKISKIIENIIKDNFAKFIFYDINIYTISKKPKFEHGYYHDECGFKIYTLMSKYLETITFSSFYDDRYEDLNPNSSKYVYKLHHDKSSIPRYREINNWDNIPIICEISMSCCLPEINIWFDDENIKDEFVMKLKN